jgi:hypothetical protein
LEWEVKVEVEVMAVDGNRAIGDDGWRAWHLYVALALFLHLLLPPSTEGD